MNARTALLQLKLCLLVYILLVLGGHAAYQGPRAGGVLTVLVRDVAGTPMRGVEIELFEIGPPHRTVATRYTDVGGQAAFEVTPGLRYLVTLTGSWNGKRFIPASEQNAGVFESGAISGGTGGFGVYLDPSTTFYLFTFVVAENEAGRLVPFFDMTRDPARPPEPFTYENIEGNEVRVIPPESQPPVIFAPLVTPEAATESGGAGPTIEEGAPVPESGENTEVTNSAKLSNIVGIIILVLGVLLVLGAIGVMWYLIYVGARSQQSDERGEDS
jgi:hypothetical protein